MTLVTCFLIVGPLVGGAVMARFLVGLLPARWQMLVIAGIALAGLGLHLVQFLAELADYRTNHALGAGQRFVLAALVTALFSTDVFHLGRRRRRAEADPGSGVVEPDERARLASTLHDTVGQGLAVIVMQLRNATRDPSGSLTVIDHTAKETMVEVRLMIDDLRRPDGAVSDVVDSDLMAMVNQFRAAGLPIEMCIRGHEIDVPPELRLVVRRVLREALTNALKHAPQEVVVVEVAIEDQVRVLVTSELGGRGPEELADDCWRGGEGLRGLAELVTQHDGMLRCGPRGSFFEVRVVLPLPGAVRLLIGELAAAG